MKLICLGDSLTEGLYGAGYIDALRPLLPACEIINAGVGGDTLLNLLARLERDVLDHQPDKVFVMAGGNDAISACQPNTRSYYKSAKNIPEGYVDIDRFEAAYRNVLTQLHSHHILVYVGLPPSEYNPTVVNTMRAYNQRARETAEGLQIPVLDLMTAFAPETIPDRPPLDMAYILTIGSRVQQRWNDYESARRKGGFSFTFDGLHLTQPAAERAARLIADFIDS